MSKHLVLIHGRSQEFKDADVLKQTWLDSLNKGIQNIGKALPIPESHIHFPYYGQTLFDMVNGKSVDEAANIIVRGEGGEKAAQDFIREVLGEIADHVEIPEEHLSDDKDVIERGALDWEWVQAFVRVLDRTIPGASGAAVALATQDVYKYLTIAALRRQIDEGVKQAIPATDETVIVSHSLGTVVAYSILKDVETWNVTDLITLGSPLGVSVIKDNLRPIHFPKAVGGDWRNALDQRDVVALYQLSANRFKVDPAIINFDEVKNPTPNHHGISGYLEDPIVAKWIHDCLTK